jgi:hypothetical protein
MTRLSRLKEYAAMQGPKGASRDEANLDYWARRASENSQIAPRAIGSRKNNGATTPDLDPPKLPSTGKGMKLRDTGSAPRFSRNADAAMKAARADTNDVGSSFMKQVRRIS